MPELARYEIIARPEDIELVEAVLALRVSHGWEEDDAPDGRVLFRVHSHQRESLEELDGAIRQFAPEVKSAISMVPELDWVESWKDFFTPVEAGSRFLVLAPWMEDEKAATDRMTVIIEPKTAFGTGHHATTALCLTALSDLADAGDIKSGQKFLDLGTGSGILGIGAALLGLTGLGVDPDLQAVENSLENRTVNGVSPESFVVARGSLEAVSGGPFDLILANILAEPLVNMAGGIAAQLAEGGILVLSGLLDSQADMVEEAYRAAGLGPALRRRKEEWAALIFGPSSLKIGR